MVEIFSLKVEKETDKVIIHIEVDKEKFKSIVEPLLMGIVHYAALQKAPESTVKENCAK
jgi:hypothetical protein